MKKKKTILFFLPALFALMTGICEAIDAEIVFVANNGIDTPSCGTRHEPCRSISRGIDIVEEGGLVLVGAGRYGDLNGDEDFDDPGDESAEIGYGCRCMIHVEKSITLLSTEGAAATVLDANGAIIDVVNITADDVVFGGKHKGFSLTGAKSESDDDGVGLVVNGGHGTKIIGNNSLNNDAAGFEIRGERHVLKHNNAVGNGSGFIFAFTEKGHIVENNTASVNGNEVYFGNGFSVTGNNFSFQGNNSYGNGGIGILINSTEGASILFKRNSIVGNRGVGIWILSGPGLKIRKNRIFGNLGEKVFYQSEALNCGIVNDSGKLIDATWNYWGAASGPGPDPADEAGKDTICDRDGTTIVEPFIHYFPKPKLFGGHTQTD